MSSLVHTRERLNQLVTRGEALIASLQAGNAERDEAALLSWRLNAVTAVAHLVPDKHHYRHELRRIAQDRGAAPVRALELTLGVLYAVRDDLEAGALADVRGLLRREVLLDLLDRAEDHYERGYIEAAAILLITILEDQLRSLMAMNDLPPARSFDVTSAQLCKAAILDRDVCLSLQRWGDLGTRLIQHAGGVQRAEVAELLDGVARFLDAHPAAQKTPPRELTAPSLQDRS